MGPRAESSYLEKHLIPQDRALWKLDRFDDFIAERKKLIAERFKSLLVPSGLQQSTNMIPSSTTRVSSSKRIASLIEANALVEGEPLVLAYKGRSFVGHATRTGIELEEGVFSPSEAAVRCYFNLILDGIPDAQVKTIVGKLDKHHSELKTSNAPWRREHLRALVTGSTEPAVKPPSSPKRKKESKPSK